MSLNRRPSLLTAHWNPFRFVNLVAVNKNITLRLMIPRQDEWNIISSKCPWIILIIVPIGIYLKFISKPGSIVIKNLFKNTPSIHEIISSILPI
jgi:hypothetical protein